MLVYDPVEERYYPDDDGDMSWLTTNILDLMPYNREYTTDLCLLNQFENHYVFVYGSLKKGFSRHSVMEQNFGNQFCGNAETIDQDYELTLCAKGIFPVLLQGTGNTTRLGAVSGQVYLVPTSTILKLDRIESNGVLYERVYRRVTCAGKTFPAYVYLGINDFWRQTDLVDLPMLPREDNKKVHFFHEASASLIARNYLKKSGEVDVH